MLTILKHGLLFSSLLSSSKAKQSCHTKKLRKNEGVYIDVSQLYKKTYIVLYINYLFFSLVIVWTLLSKRKL